METVVKQIELTKISLQPGDTLAVTIASDDLTVESLHYLGDRLRELFPDNKVLVLSTEPAGSIRFTKIEPEAVANPAESCSAPCKDCSCGKSLANQSRT